MSQHGQLSNHVHPMVALAAIELLLIIVLFAISVRKNAIRKGTCDCGGDRLYSRQGRTDMPFADDANDHDITGDDMDEFFCDAFEEHSECDDHLYTESLQQTQTINGVETEGCASKRYEQNRNVQRQLRGWLTDVGGGKIASYSPSTHLCQRKDLKFGGVDMLHPFSHQVLQTGMAIDYDSARGSHASHIAITITLIHSNFELSSQTQIPLGFELATSRWGYSHCTRVQRGSTAWRAGLRVGDVIFMLEDRVVPAGAPDTLLKRMNHVFGTHPALRVTVLRRDLEGVVIW
eukprot:m.42666 g.42666  ORF g.42666 m.42666 type:complete len:290 (-) comp19177_c0_seq1:246-1115(-)